MNPPHANPHINGRRRPEEKIRGGYVYATLVHAPPEGQMQLHEVLHYAQQQSWLLQLQTQNLQAHVQQLQMYPDLAQLQVQQNPSNRAEYASLLRSQQRETLRVSVAGANEAARKTLS